jgi:hypothetical protein
MDFSKEAWKCGTSSRVLILQAWSCEFKLQFHQKKKKNQKQKLKFPISLKSKTFPLNI